MAYSFREEEIARFRECFSYITKKKYLSSENELGVIMRSLGYSPNVHEISHYYKKYAKADGHVDFPAFLEAMHDHSKVENVDKELLMAFKAHDEQKRGYVPASELRHMLTRMGEKLTRQEVDTILRDANIPPNGQVNYKEFVKSLLIPVPDY